MPRAPEMTTVRRRPPPRCAHNAKAQPPAGDGGSAPTPSTQEVEAILASMPHSVTTALVGPNAVQQLIPEESPDDDRAGLRRLIRDDVPTLVLVIPAAGTFFPAQLSTLTGLLTVWFPACEGEAAQWWSDSLSGEHAATHLFLRLNALFDREKLVTDKHFVPSRGRAAGACCRGVCAVRWCRACVAAWTLSRAAALAGSGR